ncbi:MAG: carbohydrate kinase family protein [Anaerolineae bacterium]|nr:carbohydrate kinase family protein [Anaerolineae bacterium]MCO5194489.1 carbohydrate kinase family protein [Anaerolineae bacterium]
MDEHVLVIGGTLWDAKGKPTAGLEQHTSNPGLIHMSRGGGGRNVAENLGRLGADVVFISAVGDDEIGHRLIEQTQSADVNTEYMRVLPNAHTGCYMAFLNADGSLAVAIDDTSVMEHITPDYVYRHRRLVRDADMVYVDGSLSESTLKTVMTLAAKYKVPVCADPSSTRVAYKFRPYTTQIKLAVPNAGEAAALSGDDYSGFDPDDSLSVARHLRHLGVEIAVITLSDFGLVYDTGYESGYLPGHDSKMVDSTGTGDAIAAAIMFGLLNDLPPVQCMRLGVAAAALTVQTTDTVVPDLSLDMLFDHLLV